MYKIKLKKNQKYSLCSCGKSNSIPYCDNKHRHINKLNRTNFKSIKLITSNDVDVKLFSNMWDKNNE